jgi:hypothetical protein
VRGGRVLDRKFGRVIERSFLTVRIRRMWFANANSIFHFGASRMVACLAWRYFFFGVAMPKGFSISAIVVPTLIVAAFLYCWFFVFQNGMF